jgi:transcriptional regulator with XRE-family HTH domain
MSREKFSIANGTSSRGQNLRKVRTFLGLTQAKLAERVGWKWKKVQDIESGKQKLTRDIAHELEQAWGIRTAWLLEGKEPMMVPGPLREGSPNGDRPAAPPELYEVVHNLSGRVTIVTAEEIQLIHKLLRVLRSEDPGLVQAITANLVQFERLSRLLNARFGDIILLERRQTPRDQKGLRC